MENVSLRQIMAHAMLVQPCLCLAHNGLRRIFDTADGLVHGCPENNIGRLGDLRFSVFDHVGRSVPAVCKKMNGESDFYLYELHKMCSSYGLDLDAFI